MGSAAHELDDLRQAADRAVSQAVSDLVAATADSPTSDSPSSGSVSAQLVVVGPGQPGEFSAAGSISFASFGREVTLPAMVEGKQSDREQSDREQSDRELPTPLMVARYLASRDLVAHPEHADLWASARWIATSGAGATALGEQLRANGARVALILVADGATCHGPKAPRAQDPRAQAYDEGVCSALASGQPGRLAQLDAELGDELEATGPQVWPVLIAAAGIDGTSAAGIDGPLAAGIEGTPTSATDGIDEAHWVGEVLWAGAPYGVGWAVAAWRQSATSTAVAHT
jgi:hypothetical protein